MHVQLSCSRYRGLSVHGWFEGKLYRHRLGMQSARTQCRSLQRTDRALPSLHLSFARTRKAALLQGTCAENCTILAGQLFSSIYFMTEASKHSPTGIQLAYLEAWLFHHVIPGQSHVKTPAEHNICKFQEQIQITKSVLDFTAELARAL